jgi:hypothetical protein
MKLLEGFLKNYSPSLLIEEFESVQPMSDEAFKAYKILATDTTWSFGRVYFRIKDED